MSSITRLKPLGLSPEDYIFDYFPNQIQTHADTPALNRSSAKQPYFTDDESGNIKIFYPSINGAGIIYQETAKGHDYYCRTRYADPENHKDKDGNPIRYKSDAGTGIQIFIPLNTLNKIRNNHEIKTLHIVEGEFKAVFADSYGVDIIGIAGIHMFIEKKGVKRLHPEIKEIIEKCKVKNLNLIFDADCRVVKFEWDDLPLKDYSQRLISFYSAVFNFKLAVTTFNENITKNNILVESGTAGIMKEPIHYYATQVRQEYNDTAKGLDDLYTVLTSDVLNITDELNSLVKAKSWFHCINLNNQSKVDLDKHFFLETDRIGRPIGFYNKFPFEISDRKFVFWGNQYRWNLEKQELDILYHKELSEYIRVGIKYFRKIKKTNLSLGKDNENIYSEKQSIKLWDKTSIQLDFVEGKGIKSAFHNIMKYTDFCNIPGHNEDYKSVYNQEYNMYYPLPHEPKLGSWSTIEKFLKHLSQNKYQDKYDILLDILCLKYTNPIVKLPVTVLYSKEKNTGKSTLLWLLNDIYCDNSSVISNNDLTLDFNDYLLGNVLLIDEAIIGDKALEMIKSLSTAPETTINMKNMPKLKVIFFGTFFLATNRLTFVNIDDDENRFLILHVPEISKEEYIEDIEVKMRDEIPAFLYYLRNIHKLKCERKQSRFWFPIADLETPALKELKQKSKKQSVRALHEWVKEMFFTHLINEFEATPTMIGPEIRKYTARDISFTEIVNTLQDEFGLKPSLVHRFKFPKLIEMEGEPVSEFTNHYFDKSGIKKYYSGSTYILKADDLLNLEEILELEKSINENGKSQTSN